MLRYVALVWNVMSLSQQRAAAALLRHWRTSATKWQEALLADGVCVFFASAASDGRGVHLLRDQSGVLFGTVFDRSCLEVPGACKPLCGPFNEQASAAVVKSTGRVLVDRYWGSYVAIIRDSAAGTIALVRSPAGTLPCLHTQARGIHIYFSSAAECELPDFVQFSVNWRYVARHLADIEHDHDTGFSEVTELLPGQCVQLSTRSPAQRTLHYWNALDFARADPIRDTAQAAAQVRTTLSSCVHAWAACHPSIWHRLSGGLDSSIVLACLQSAPSTPRVVCANRYSRRADSDEREFARLAARHTACELIELERDPGFNLEDVFEARLSERPVNYIMEFGQARPEVLLARERGITAIFEGTYGDQLFFGHEGSLAAADYVHDVGVRAGLLDVAISTAQLANFSVWKVLREGLSKGLIRNRWDPIRSVREKNLLIDEDAQRSLVGSEPAIYAWYDIERYVPPGKQFHVFSATSPHFHAMPFREGDEMQFISPLLSQPLVELCLRIPTYVLAQNGWDREIERLAFSSCLPQEIARRRTKGGQADFSAEVKRRNHVLISDILLNGELVRSGLLIRSQLERAFAGRSGGLDIGPGRVSTLLTVEVWLKILADRTRRAISSSSAAVSSAQVQ